MKNFWNVLWVESSKSGDQYPHYQERVEARQLKGGVLVHTVSTVWCDDDNRSLSEALTFIPGITLGDLAREPDADES